MRLCTVAAVSLLFPLASIAASANLPVPSNLTADGVPPIPAPLMETLDAYGDFRAAAFLDWAPGAREMLIATRFGQTPQIHRVAMPGGARTQLTFYSDRISGARYRPSGGAFLFTKDTGGGEWYQLYLYDEKTRAIRLLTDGKSRNTGPVWSRDGSRIAWASTRRDGKDSDIWVMDPEHPEAAHMVVEANSGGWSAEDFSPDGKSLLVGRYRSIYDAAIYRIDLASGARQSIGLEKDAVSYNRAVFAPDGKRLYLRTNQDSDFERLAVFDLSSRKLEFPLPALAWDVSAFELSKDGRFLAYVVNEDGAEKLHIAEPRSWKEAPLPALPMGNVSSLGWRPGASELAFTVTSSHSPGDVYSLDLESRRLDRWTFSETGGVDAKAFAAPELIRWKSFDGLTVSGYYYRPPARFSGARPVIVNIHGGPEGQFQPGYLGAYNYLIDELGIALIFPNVRGSSGYGTKFVNLDNGVKREDSVKDIGALLDWIGAQPTLDLSRIMVTGGSYGGYMTLASMTHYNARFRCALDVVGISNWITFLEHTEPYRRDLRRVEYGDERDPKMRDFLSTISPMAHGANITKPMFIVAGHNDPRVPYTEGRQMEASLRGNGVPVWFLMADDEGHGFAKKGNRDYQFAATVLFIEKYLLP